MIILDENFPESQRQLLRGWNVPIRQIGYEVGKKGMQDDEIIPFLLRYAHKQSMTLPEVTNTVIGLVENMSGCLAIVSEDASLKTLAALRIARSNRIHAISYNPSVVSEPNQLICDQQPARSRYDSSSSWR